MSNLPSKIYTDHAMMDEIVYNLKIIINDIVLKNDMSANENETEESLHDSEILLDCMTNMITLSYMPFTIGMLWDFYKDYFTKLGLLNTGDPVYEPSENMVLRQIREDVYALMPNNGTEPDFSVLNQNIHYLIPIVDEDGNYVLDDEGNYTYKDAIYKVEYSNELLEYCKKWYINNYIEKNNYYRMLNGLPEYGYDEDMVPYSKTYGILPYKVCKEMNNTELLNKMDIFVRSGQLNIKQYMHEMDSITLNLLDTIGVYEYIISLYGTRPHYKYINYIGAKKIDPFTARQASNWDILYIPQVEPLILQRFKEVYIINRDIYQKNTYQEAYKIYSKYYDELMMLLITSQTITDIISEIPEWYIRRDVFDLRTCRYFLESQGVKFFKTIPLRYQIRIVKNLNKLIKFKSTNTSIEDIIAIFSNEDISVFKYYMFKKYDSNHSYFPTEILDENPYFYMNKRYDYGEEPVDYTEDGVPIIALDVNNLLPPSLMIPTLTGIEDEDGTIYTADTSTSNGNPNNVEDFVSDTITVTVNRYMTKDDQEYIDNPDKYYVKENGEIIDAETYERVYVSDEKTIEVFGSYVTDPEGNPIQATEDDVNNAINGAYLPDGSVITSAGVLFNDVYDIIESVDENGNTITIYGKVSIDTSTGEIWRDVDGNPIYDMIDPTSYDFTMSKDQNFINNNTLYKTDENGNYIDEDGNLVTESGKEPAEYPNVNQMVDETSGYITNPDGTTSPIPTFNQSFMGSLLGTNPEDEVTPDPANPIDYSVLLNNNSTTNSPSKGEKLRNKIYNELGWNAPKYRPDSINCICEGDGIDESGMVYTIEIDENGNKVKKYDWETEYQHKMVYDFGEEFASLDNIPSKEPFTFTIDRYGNAYEMEFVRTPINESYDNYIELNSYREDYDIVIDQDTYWDGIDRHDYVKSLHLKREETIENTKLMFIDFNVDQKDFNKQMELFISLIFNKYANIDDVEIVVDKINPNTTFKLTNVFILLFCLSRAMEGKENIPFIDKIARSNGKLPKPTDIEDLHDDKEYGITTEYDQRTDWMLMQFNDSIVDERNEDFVVYDGGYPDEIVGTEFIMMDGGEEPVSYTEEPVVYDGSDLQVYERNNPRYYVNCSNRITGFNFGIDMHEVASVLAIPHSTFGFDHPTNENYKYIGEPGYDKVYYENHWEDFDYKHYELSDFGIDKFGIENSIGKSSVETTDDLLKVFENNYSLYKKICEILTMECDSNDKVVVLQYIHDTLFTMDYDEAHDAMYTYETLKYKVQYEMYTEEEVESAKAYVYFTEHYLINYELNEEGKLDKYYTIPELIAKTWEELEASDDPEILLAIQYRLLAPDGKATYDDPKEAYDIFKNGIEAGDTKYTVDQAGIKTPIVVYEKIWNGTEYVDDLDNPVLVLDDYGMPIPEVDDHGNLSYIKKTATKYEDLLKAKDYTLYTWYKAIVTQEDQEVKADSIREVLDQIISTLQFYLNSENTKYIFSYISTNTPQAVMGYIGLMIDFFKSWKLQFLGPISSYTVNDKIETYAHAKQDKFVEIMKREWLNELAVNTDALNYTRTIELEDYKGSGRKETLDIYGYHQILLDDPIIYDGKRADYKDKSQGSNIEYGNEYELTVETDIMGDDDIVNGYPDNVENGSIIVNGVSYPVPAMIAGMDPGFVSQFLDDFLDEDITNSIILEGGNIGSDNEDEKYARPYKLIDGGNITARIDLSILDGGGPANFSESSFVAYLDGGDISKLDYTILDPITGELPEYTIDGGVVTYFYMRGNYYDDRSDNRYVFPDGVPEGYPEFDPGDKDFDYHYESIKFNIDNLHDAASVDYAIGADVILSKQAGNSIFEEIDGLHVSQTSTPEYIFDRFKRIVTNKKIEYTDIIANYKEDIFLYGAEGDQRKVITETYNNLFAIPYDILDLFLDTIGPDPDPEIDIHTIYNGAGVRGIPEGEDFTMINGGTEPAPSESTEGENYNGGEELYMDFVYHNYKASYYRKGYLLKSNTDIIKEIAEQQTEDKTIELVNWAKDLKILGWSYY